MKRGLFIIAALVAFVLVPNTMYAKQKWYSGNRICIDGKQSKDGSFSGRCSIMVFQDDCLQKGKKYFTTSFDRVMGDFSGHTAVNAVLDISGVYDRTQSGPRPGETYDKVHIDEKFVDGSASSGITFRGTVEVIIDNTGDKVSYLMKAGGTISTKKGNMIVPEDMKVSRIIYESELYAWKLESNDKIHINSGELCKGGFMVISSLPADLICRYSFPLEARLTETNNGLAWRITDNDKWVNATSVRTNRQVRLGSGGNTYVIQDSGITFSDNPVADTGMISGTMPSGDPVRESANVSLKRNYNKWDGEIKYDDGVVYKGTVYLVKGKKNNRSYSETVRPSIYEEDPLYFKKLTVADNIVFVNGTRYGPDGNVEETYKDGWSNLEIEAARNRATIAKQEEQQKQAQARAEKEKNTKATQAFLNSAWGKRFTFNGFEDTYGNYHHGSSVLRFSNNRTDIYLDVEGETHWFKIDHIADDTGKDIWVRNWNGMMAVVYITPMMRNGKRVFKVHFTTADLVYYLY